MTAFERPIRWRATFKCGESKLRDRDHAVLSMEDATARRGPVLRSFQYALHHRGIPKLSECEIDTHVGNRNLPALAVEGDILIERRNTQGLQILPNQCACSAAVWIGNIPPGPKMVG